MGEVKTVPVRAVFQTREQFFNDDMLSLTPGAICESDEPGRWLYACPCGCGATGSVRVGAGQKPAERPSWIWNGSRELPVLSPSVHHVGHWHGWLGGPSGEQPGWWVSC